MSTVAKERVPQPFLVLESEWRLTVYFSADINLTAYLKRNGLRDHAALPELHVGSVVPFFVVVLKSPGDTLDSGIFHFIYTIGENNGILNGIYCSKPRAIHNLRMVEEFNVSIFGPCLSSPCMYERCRPGKRGHTL
jgi:hypothetical protein